MILIFELGPEGSTESRQSENGVGCACTKASVRRKAWSGRSWQLGLGRAVSCLLWLKPRVWGCRHRRGQQGRNLDCFTDIMSRKQREPRGIFKQQSDTVKPGLSNNQHANACMGVQMGDVIGVFCNSPRGEG